MEEVIVTVTCQIDYNDAHEPTMTEYATLRVAVQQAIENAVRSAENNGFSHVLAEEANVSVVSVEAL